MTHRPLAKDDIPWLQAALDANEFHSDQKTEHYTGLGMYSVVYEDSKGPVGVIRYTKAWSPTSDSALRICGAWCDNSNHRRNALATLHSIRDTVELARTHGYTEILVDSTVERFRKFMGNLGFKKADGDTMVLEVR